MNEIDLTDGKGRHRPEDALPAGYVPSHQTQLEHVAQELGAMRLAADIIAEGGGSVADRFAAADLSRRAGIAQRVLRAIVGGARPAAAATVPAAAPAIEVPQPDTGIVQHSTRFNRGAWFDQGNGDLYVAAPLLELTPRFGWLPSPWETVVVQESTKRGIRTRAILTRTNAEGIARGLFHIGGGVHYLRVLHPADLWTLGTTGTWRRVVVTTEPLDVN